MMEFDWCELTGEMSCPQPMELPASRCDLCLGCLDRKFHAKPTEVSREYMSDVSSEA